MKTALWSAGWPPVLLAGLAAMLFRLPPGPYLATLTGLVLAVAAALAWRFHSSRVLLTVVLLGGLLCALLWPPWCQDAAGRPVFLLPLCLGMLIPLNMLVLSALTERGIGNVPGLLRLLAILSQGLAVVHEAQFPNVSLAAFANGHTWWTADLVVGWLCVLALALRSALTTAPLDSGLSGALLAAGLALCRGPQEAPVWVLAGGTVLIVALVQHSYHMAFLDELTGIPARRSLRQELSGLSGRYTIAMVDIDHFKNFNDTYGHDVGDQCLRLVASRLSRVSGGGRAFRYGGEEFTVLFPGKVVKEAMGPLETLRQTIEGNPMVLRGANRPRRKPRGELQARPGPQQKVTVTVSIGVAERGTRSNRPDEVIKAADQALYRAKRKGRNQVCR